MKRTYPVLLDQLCTIYGLVRFCQINIYDIWTYPVLSDQGLLGEQQRQLRGLRRRAGLVTKGKQNSMAGPVAAVVTGAKSEMQMQREIGREGRKLYRYICYSIVCLGLSNRIFIEKRAHTAKARLVAPPPPPPPWLRPCGVIILAKPYTSNPTM